MKSPHQPYSLESDAQAYLRRVPGTANGQSRPKNKRANNEDLVTEITELKKSNRRDLEEIKKLKAEQHKIER